MRNSTCAFRYFRTYAVRKTCCGHKNICWRPLGYSKVPFSTSPKQTAETLIEKLWSSKNLDSIRASCSAFAERIQDGKVIFSSKQSTSQEQIRMVLASLASSGHEEDMRHIKTVLCDVYPLLGLTPTRPDYMFVFQRLFKHGHLQEALSFLLAMKELPGKFTPETIHFNKILERWSETAPFGRLQRSVAAFYDVNPKLTNETFLLLLNAHFASVTREGTPLDFKETCDLVRWCIDKGMSFDPIISGRLYQVFADHGDFGNAGRIVTVYESASRPEVDFDEDSGSPTEPTSSAFVQALEILASATSYSDILAVSESLSFSCQSPHYGLVIANCVKSGKVEDAFDIYAQSKQKGVIPTATMVSPLIKSLYNGNYLDASDEAVDRALEIYRHLLDAWPGARGNGPTKNMYYALIRMAISSPNTTKYLPIIQSLLSDMEFRGFTDNASFIAATKIIVEMREAGSFSEVIDFYRQHRGKLDQQGFVQILQEYCRLSFSGDLELPLITEYFSILNHMRMQNVPLTPKAYTIILHQVGLVATKLRYSLPDPNLFESIYQRLAETTRRIHHFITLDASISPDAILWNQLMNTYQRLGLFRDMEKLWQVMYLSGRFDQVTVNIMIDACGYSGNLRFVRSLFTKLLKAGYCLDGRNWDTLVEALCRNNHFGEALEVICVEMEKHEVKPQVETIRIFQKFGRKQGVWNLYKPSIESALPDLWSSLPERIKET